MTTFLPSVEHIDGIVVVTLLIAVISIFTLFSLISCLRNCLFRSPRRKKVITQHEYHGSWQSKIYSQEKGSIKITFETVKGGDRDEDDDITAEVTLTYVKESMYRPNQTFAFMCELVYNDDDKKYYLRQCNFGDGQYFTLNFNKRLNKSEAGYLTSISPHDLVSISFDKEKCI